MARWTQFPKHKGILPFSITLQILDSVDDIGSCAKIRLFCIVNTITQGAKTLSVIGLAWLSYHIQNTE